ncbi:hypothetical protein DM806_04840 [Sphingobium lactosutens]|uniref:hypothetical protein n=1 Tax=Sphingobium lactosutens TaxID=522773 RepID=UPI0015B91599|nr:hypothetical protein [Sphingobium lactosutens]NWK95008.1 hypothetical protein [Sphingobium lactosutens]
MRHDPISAILTDLLRRVDGLAGQRGHVSVLRLHDEVDQIRHIARAFHLDQVEGLAGTLESALSLHGLGPVVLSYLDLLREAIGAEMPVGPIATLMPRAVPATIAPLRA